MSYLNAIHLHDERAAYAFVEARVWPQGRVCPHCGVVGESSAMKGKSTRIGAYKCYACRKPFTVKIGTIFESSHVPLHLWLQAIFLIASSKKGISSNQLHRTLGVTLKTAWFMSHRIREAMKAAGGDPLGGEGKIVEADETYYGKPAEPKPVPRLGDLKRKKLNRMNDRPIVSLVERGGKVRSFHVKDATKENVSRIVRENVAKESRLHTDESRLYTGADQAFATHETVKHSAKEYARGDVTTNSVEGFFSVFKRGMRGTYQHCAEKHLHRYLAEFDFRFNNRTALGVDDDLRTEQLVQGVVGKRLTYQTTNRGTGLAGA
jgi:transposase-like protein